MNERNMTLLTDIAHLDVAGWDVSEKFHGCRAFWDGSRFWTRGGNVVAAPEWFTAGLPVSHLDGEIYAGYGNFQAARLATQYGRFIDRIVFKVFDAPGFRGSCPERLAKLHDLPPHCQKVRYSRVDSIGHLCSLLGAVRADGGEGLVLRNPAAVEYVTGRSFNAVRVKSLAEIEELKRIVA